MTKFMKLHLKFVKILPLFLAVVLTAASINSLRAKGLCTSIQYLIDQSRFDFSDVVNASGKDAGVQDAKLVLAGASSCTVTIQAQRNWYQCEWKYAYRDRQAYDNFDSLVRRVHRCIGEKIDIHTDRNVNHPDYYALRRFELEHANVSVSLKDKSALQNTLVFVRVAKRRTND